MKVLIVTGGNSSERKISLESAGNVAKALIDLGHKIESFDLIDGFEKLKKRLGKYDLVFPVIHGKEGEGGDLQEFLEKNKIKFVGSGSKACRKGWDKFAFKKFCIDQKILTPKYKEIDKYNYKKINFKMPFVIKPPEEGSSINLFLIKTNEDLKKINFNELFQRYKSLMVEEYINGIEVTVGVLKTRVLPVIEIRPPKGEMFDYENKYNGKTEEILDAPSLLEDIRNKLQQITWEIHSKLGCRDFSRTDFIVNKNKIYALEINTIPGLTKESLLPKEGMKIGLSFKEMLKELINGFLEKEKFLH